MTKTTIIVCSLATAVAAVSCQRPVPLVPPNTRTVVEPTPEKALKSWNSATRQEGEAVLGPLATPRR